MRKQTAYLLASLVASGGGAPDQAAAKLVHGGTTNPAVEAGGHPLRGGSTRDWPASLIGAIAAEAATNQSARWSWRRLWRCFGGWRPGRHGPLAPGGPPLK